MILINKVTPFANETFQKDLIECILHNIDINFITNIIVFYNNSNIEVPKHDKVKLIIKSNFSDKDIIEYCKLISNEEVFIFSNPFIKFNSTLINIEKPLKSVIKLGNDCFIFNRNEKLIGSSIEDILKITTSSSKILINRKHLWTEEIKQISPRFILQKANIKKIDAIIVSVDYNDFLQITLEKVSSMLNVTVVTSPNDTICHKICEKYGVNCVITDKMYENGSIFNKGKAINEGLKSIVNPDWILIMDADIYLQDDFLDVVKNSNINSESLVICKRLIIENVDDFEKWKSGEKVGRVERAKGFGYFQMFNFYCRSNVNFFYSDKYEDASFSDLEFRDRFKIKRELNTYVLHLGDTGRNWSGRISKGFIDNDYSSKILSDNLVFSLLKNLQFYIIKKLNKTM